MVVYCWLVVWLFTVGGCLIVIVTVVVGCCSLLVIVSVTIGWPHPAGERQYPNLNDMLHRACDVLDIPKAVGLGLLHSQ